MRTKKPAAAEFSDRGGFVDQFKTVLFSQLGGKSVSLARIPQMPDTGFVFGDGFAVGVTKADAEFTTAIAISFVRAIGENHGGFRCEMELLLCVHTNKMAPLPVGNGGRALGTKVMRK